MVGSKIFGMGLSNGDNSMSVTGAIKVLGVPDDACLTTVRDLVMQLEKYLSVEFDEEKITNVIVSTTEPDTTSRDVLWFRIDTSGNFIGLHVFIQGQWIQQFPVPDEVFWIRGRSDTLPPGYVLLTEDMPDSLHDSIVSKWILHPDAGEDELYAVFEVVYVGL